MNESLLRRSNMITQPTHPSGMTHVGDQEDVRIMPVVSVGHHGAGAQLERRASTCGREGRSQEAIAREDS